MFLLYNIADSAIICKRNTKKECKRHPDFCKWVNGSCESYTVPPTLTPTSPTPGPTLSTSAPTLTPTPEPTLSTSAPTLTPTPGPTSPTPAPTLTPTPGPTSPTPAPTTFCSKKNKTKCKLFPAQCKWSNGICVNLT